VDWTEMTLAEMEKRAILDAIKRAKGDKLLAADRLGIGKTTLYRKLKEYEGGSSKKRSRKRK
jgi:transcriptional regulator with PAS, ATPase and Fis domain